MPVTWAAEEETDAIDEKTPAGYLMVSGEHQLKNDLITKLTCVDNRLLGGRAQSKKGRAHWCPNIHQQDYLGGAKEVSSDPQVEVYWKALGLSQTAPTEELDW